MWGSHAVEEEVKLSTSLAKLTQPYAFREC
jgi:hypothetical protein